VKVNLGVLGKLCKFKERKLKKYIKKLVPDIEDWGAFMWKQTEGVKILAVAHMDVVFEDPDFKSVTTKNDILAFSPCLDDRLGIFTIINLLPQFGIEVDMLFTTDEEKCMSTASDFVKYCDKSYNWIIEFDRMGTDVVLYRYKCNVELTDDLKSVGFEIGIGSYSDISDMQDLGIAAFNMGIGYYFQHTERCCASMVDLSHQLKRLQEFYNKFKDTFYEHMPLESDVETDPYWYCRGTYKGNVKRRTPWGGHFDPTDYDDDIPGYERKDSSSADWYPEGKDFNEDDFLWEYGKVHRAQASIASGRWENLDW
jgi:hypothetical protein